MALVLDQLDTLQSLGLEDEDILREFSNHQDFDGAVASLIGYQNGSTDLMQRLVISRYSTLISTPSAHSLILERPEISLSILNHILGFKLNIAVRSNQVVRISDYDKFPRTYESFDYFSSYLIGYIFAEDEQGFIEYMTQISNGVFDIERSSNLFHSLRENFITSSSKYVLEQYRGLLGNEEPVDFADKLPDLNDLESIDLFAGFRIQAEVNGELRNLLVRVVHPADENAKSQVAEARELGYSRFGAGGKKNKKVVNYEFGPHTIIEILSLDTTPPNEYATAEVMIDSIIGTEGQRLLGKINLNANTLIETPYANARFKADTAQGFIAGLRDDHQYLPDYMKSRSRPELLAEVGTLAFKTIDKGRTKPSIPGNVLGNYMVYLFLTMASAVAKRRGISKMAGVFQEYLYQTLSQSGANVIPDKTRNLDILGVNNLGPDGNGTAANLEYYLAHANYFLSGSKIRIPENIQIEIEGETINLPVGSFLIIDASLLHKVKLVDPDDIVIWEPSNRDLFTSKGLDIARSVLSNPQVRALLVSNWSELLKNKPEDETIVGKDHFVGYVQGPRFYYQDADVLVNGLISDLEAKKKLNLNLSTTPMLNQPKVEQPQGERLADIFSLNSDSLPPIPDLNQLNQRNSAVVELGSSWEALSADLEILDKAESNRFIKRELNKEAFLHLIGMRRGDQISLNMPAALNDIKLDQEDGALRWDFRAEPDYFNCTILDFTHGQFANSGDVLNKCRFILVGHGKQKFLYIIDDIEKFEAVRMCRAWATLTSTEELHSKIADAEVNGVKLVGSALHEAILSDPLLQKLRNHTSIAVVGQGTAGRPTAKAIAQLGVRGLTLFELPEEVVSLSNTQRLTNQGEISLSKLMVSATDYQMANPFMDIQLGGALNEQTIELLNRTDLVILAADQPAQVLIHEYCFKHGIDVLLGTDIGFGSEVIFFEYSSPDAKLLNGKVTLEELAENPGAVLKMLGLVTVLTQGDSETLYAFRARSAGHLAGLPQNQFAPLTNAALLGSYVRSIVSGIKKLPATTYVDPEISVNRTTKFGTLLRNIMVLYRTRKLSRMTTEKEA